MSRELDELVAEKVMGEPRPSDNDYEFDMEAYPWSSGGSYSRRMSGGEWMWVPRRFSTNFDCAMKAVDAFLDQEEGGHVGIDYRRVGRREWDILITVDRPRQSGEFMWTRDEVPHNDLARAICELLVEIKEEA